ncbi:lipid A deacylase LpxR family protein [Noviherbaspirillum massiliense]|uniref:lipid A deacylase LpxR family protein n=1 Tax=Noviherbaspirillum massiliense TaxID=1465823 RepID=UPI00036A7120|nr:lipid A deacylase LpxR family protein [Noviherbaspirillum massiliense]
MSFVLVAASCNAAAGPLADLYSDYQRVASEGRKTHIADIDNDSLTLKNEDSLYTSGFRYTRKYTLEDSGGATAFSWRVGQELYTPSDIKLPPEDVGPPDHPYAGWLYLGFFKERFGADGSHTKVGVDLGCLGPCAGGKWTQTNLHRLINQNLPRGWSKQVKNEVGVILHAEMTPVRWMPTSWLDIAPRIEGRFGNIHTDVTGGLTLRAGQLNVLPERPGWFGFVRADMRAVAYDATLQGGYFSSNNPHVVDPRRWVGEAEAGMAWSSGKYGARVSLVRRGNEIRGLSDSIGVQNFLRLQFSYTP